MAYSLLSSIGVAGASDLTSSSLDSTGASLLIGGISQYSGSPGAAISDNKGNPWTGLTRKQGGSEADIRIYYAESPVVGSGHTISATGNAIYASVLFQAWSGAATSSVFDQENGNSTSIGTSLSTGSITPTQDNELVITAFASSGGSSGTATIDSGFTADTNSTAYTGGSNEGGAFAYLVQTSAAAANPTWTVGTGISGGGLAAAIASFKAAAGGGGGNSISVPAGSLTLTGNAPTVTATANNSIAVPLATMTLTGYAPVVATNNSVAVPAGSLTLTGYAPDVRQGINIAVPAGELTLTANAPTVAVSDNQSVAVPAGSLSITGYAPGVSISDNHLIDVPAGSLTLTGIAPVVEAGGPRVIDVPLGVLSITVYAPRVVATGSDTGGGGPDPRRRSEYEWELFQARLALRREREKLEAAKRELKAEALEAKPDIADFAEIKADYAERIEDLKHLERIVSLQESPPEFLAPPARAAYVKAASKPEQQAYEALLKEVEAQQREEEVFFQKAVNLLLGLQ